MCIGGGPVYGAGMGWTTGGEVTGAPDSSNIAGWGGWSANVGVGPASGQFGGGSIQAIFGLNVGWTVGVAGVRCLTYQVKCKDESCE